MELEMIIFWLATAHELIKKIKKEKGHGITLFTVKIIGLHVFSVTFLSECNKFEISQKGIRNPSHPSLVPRMHLSWPWMF